MELNKIYQGDSLEVLKTFPEKSMQMCMTSPPYWALRDYGTAKWEGSDTECNHKKGDGTPQSRAKSTIGYAESQGHNLESWGDYCRKCGAKRVDKQLGLESTFNEYVNKLCNIFDEVKRVLRDDGTCWVNLGDTYMNNSSYSEKGRQGYGKDKVGMINKSDSKVKIKSLTMIPMRFAIEMVNRGWILRNTIIWHKNSCMPSSVKDRFTVDFEYVFFFSKNKKYYFEQQLEPTITKDNIVRDRDTTKLNNTPGRTRMSGLKKNNYDFKNKRTTWTINTKPFKEAHFAVYPEKLCETPIKAGCPEGGIVLDPFSGAGTTSLVALKQNKNFIGIELNKEYIEIAEKRLKPYLEQTTLSQTHRKVK